MITNITVDEKIIDSIINSVESLVLETGLTIEQVANDCIEDFAVQLFRFGATKNETAEYLECISNAFWDHEEELGSVRWNICFEIKRNIANRLFELRSTNNAALELTR